MENTLYMKEIGASTGKGVLRNWKLCSRNKTKVFNMQKPFVLSYGQKKLAFLLLVSRSFPVSRPPTFEHFAVHASAQAKMIKRLCIVWIEH